MEQASPSSFEDKGSELFTILLVEDNFLNRRMTKKLLEKHYIIKEASEAEAANDILTNSTVHLVLLDIHLGQDRKDGIWLGQRLTDVYNIPFIYLTAFADVDISRMAIATHPSAYLTKPYKEADLCLSINLVLQNYRAEKSRNSNFIMAKDGDYFVKLFIAEVEYFESSGNYLLVFCGGKMYKCRSTTKEMLDRLPKDSFVQTHRAFLVNRSKVVKFNSVSVIVGNHILPLSGKYAANLTSSAGQ